ncbi:MAG: hypothetical protein ACKOWG_12925, partial [Planctomycetia bacterium]
MPAAYDARAGRCKYRPWTPERCHSGSRTRSRIVTSDSSGMPRAAAKLNALGAAAVDPLLAAAELSDDLEIALRARWLVDT